MLFAGLILFVSAAQAQGPPAGPDVSIAVDPSRVDEGGDLLFTLTATLVNSQNILVAQGMVSRQPVAISSREFALVFTPLEIEMLTGESETVVLTLTDAALLPERGSKWKWSCFPASKWGVPRIGCP